MAREAVNSGLLFDLAKLEADITSLSAESEEENFWNNRSKALEVIANLNHAKDIVETYTGLLNSHKDLEELLIDFNNSMRDLTVNNEIIENYIEPSKVDNKEVQERPTKHIEEEFVVEE